MMHDRALNLRARSLDMPEPFAESEKTEFFPVKRGTVGDAEGLRGQCRRPPGAGVTRRSFLQAGVLGLGGLALPDLLRLRDRRPRRPGRAGRASSCSGSAAGRVTWRPGTPSPTPRAEFRGPFGAIPTSLPGVHFGELLPEQARRMDRAGGPADGQPRLGRPHQGQPLDAHRLRGPRLQRPRQRGPAPAFDGLGRGPAQGVGRDGPAALRRRAASARRDRQPVPLRGLPRRLLPTRSSSSPTRTTRSFGSRTSIPKGRHARPPGRPPPRARGAWTASAGRRSANSATSTLITSAPSTCSTGKDGCQRLRHRRGAVRVRDRYGRHTFGQSALLARRLVEAGTPFVTVNCVPWDHHGTGPQLKTEEGARS